MFQLNYFNSELISQDLPLNEGQSHFNVQMQFWNRFVDVRD